MKEEVEVTSSQIGNDYAFFKPGQKYPTPSPGNGDRVFYETLLEQRPNSEMAQDWCLSYGVLDAKKAEELFEFVQIRKRKPGAILSPPRKLAQISVKAQRKRKGVKLESESDDDENEE